MEQVLQEVYRFDLFQAVRLLEKSAFLSDGARRLPVGYDAPPERESVRFVAQASLGFPASAAVAARSKLSEDKQAAQPTLTVSCMGLTGPAGVLPQHYTAQLIAQLREKEPALRDFFDLFNHRLMSLFYRAWTKYRLPVEFERSHLAFVNGGESTRNGRAGEDSLTTAIYCLLGLGTGGLREQMRDESAPLHYAGFLAQSTRSAINLEHALSDYLTIPAHVEQFHGQWLYLPEEDRSRLPSPGMRGPANNRLGEIVLGSRIWDVQSKFLVRLGPLNRQDFEEFLPGGKRWIPLVEMIKMFVGPQFDFAVQVVLAKSEVPRCVLNSSAPTPPRLGRNVWIWSRDYQHDVTDAVFHSDRVESPAA
jgi:type VI secretion system protein ImpH